MTKLRPQSERHERRRASSSPSRTLWYAPDLTIVDEPLLWALIKYRQRNRTQLPQPRSRKMPLPAEPNLVCSRTENGKQAPILDLDFSHEYYPSRHVPRGFLTLRRPVDSKAVQRAFNKAGISHRASVYGDVQIDVDHRYIPSTHSGHGHLYLDVELSNWAWFLLMVRLYRAGLIELGYFAWGLRRWGNFVRRPGISKSEEESSVTYSYGWLFKLRSSR